MDHNWNSADELPLVSLEMLDLIDCNVTKSSLVQTYDYIALVPIKHPLQSKITGSRNPT